MSAPERRGRYAALFDQHAAQRAELERDYEAKKRARQLAYSRTPAQRAKQKEHRDANREKARLRTAAWRADPANAARKAEYMRQWWAKTNADAPRIAAIKAKRPIWGKATIAKRLSTPEGRARHAAYVQKSNVNRTARLVQMRLTNPAAYRQYLDAINRKATKRRATTKRERAPILAYPYRAAERSPMLASVWKLIGTRAHPEIRGDLCQEIIADICAQVVTLEQLADPKVLRPYITRAHKGLSDPHLYSLDAVIPGTDGLRRIDTIEAGRTFADATHYKR